MVFMSGVGMKSSGADLSSFTLKADTPFCLLRCCNRLILVFDPRIKSQLAICHKATNNKMNNSVSDTVATPKQPILTKQVELPQFGDLETHWADDASYRLQSVQTT
jgi:hypothetical protein